MFKKAKENKKGFTLAELLIVVAIIAVLVAISIPIFTSQLAKARLATNQANARAAYAEASSQLLLDESTSLSGNITYTYTVSSAKSIKAGAADTAFISGGIADWTTTTKATDNTTELGSKTAKTWNVTFDANGQLLGFTCTF